MPSISRQSKEFLEYWKSIRPSSDQIPTKQDLSLRKLSKILPWIRLVDPIEAEEPIAPIRICGTDFYDRYKRELTGSNFLDLVKDEDREMVFLGLMNIANLPSGMWRLSHAPYPDGTVLVEETTALPVHDLTLGKNLVLLLSIPTERLKPFENKSIIGAVGLETKSKWLDIGFGVPEGKETVNF